ncbi:MAG TPA: dihydrodipicolinate reductase C-terminal domain-containing protein, partial [Candidatus Saccharimonadales bacterium]|nr:dihydrodipicolinate reductase C-terminal domain-containing protein [Candidatus Saccharimonadales bacterium]
MKIALLGTGRTGSKVTEIAGKNDVIGFDENNIPTLEKLKSCDTAISFLPGPAFIQYIDLLIESGLPVAIGSTGFDWPDDIDKRLKKNGLAWIEASNFALGMNIMRAMIRAMSKAPKLFDQFEFNMEEIHHIHKKDSPSGTALTWKEWLGQDVQISAKREGDNPGFHKLTLKTPYEDISIEHQSKDRKIFAQGAVWTARRLAEGNLPPGLHKLQDIMD